MVDLEGEQKAATADRVAYMMNTYPVTSATFIRREIEALEAEGIRVERFAARRWTQALVDPLDVAEQARTHYLLSGNLIGLCRDTLSIALTRPFGLLRAFRGATALAWAARGGLVRHAAYVMQASSLVRACDTGQIGHVHAHFSTNSAAVAMLSHLMGGPSYSFTVHGPDELVDPVGEGLRLKARHAKHVVAITSYCRGRVVAEIDAGDESKVVIVPCGLHLDEFPAEYRPPTDPDLVVCVGRLCPQKGQVHIPAAVALVKDRCPDLRVKLIGDGESRSAVEASIREHGVEDRVEIAGWAANLEVRRNVLAARALLLPSYAEGLPVVLMEAFALHRPVITTTIAGIPELVDSTCGWLVSPGDEPALAAALALSMSVTYAEHAELAREGRRRVEERHDLRKIAGLLAEVFGVRRRVSQAPPP